MGWTKKDREHEEKCKEIFFYQYHNQVQEEKEMINIIDIFCHNHDEIISKVNYR